MIVALERKGQITPVTTCMCRHVPHRGCLPIWAWHQGFGPWGTDLQECIWRRRGQQ